MKTLVVVMLLVVSAAAQVSTRIAPACGLSSASFNAKVGNPEHSVLQPDPGKARIYFIQDGGAFDNQHYTLKIGLDGTWLGAYKQSSYITGTIEPGVHHICANVQTDDEPLKDLVALAHFAAEAGKTYYFRTRLIVPEWGKDQPPAYVDLDPMDSDMAQFMITTYPLSASKQKK